MTTKAEPSWKECVIGEYYCEAEGCPTPDEENAVWHMDYEYVKGSDPAYLCGPCYENLNKKGND